MHGSGFRQPLDPAWVAGKFTHGGGDGADDGDGGKRARDSGLGGGGQQLLMGLERRQEYVFKIKGMQFSTPETVWIYSACGGVAAASCGVKAGNREPLNNLCECLVELS